MLETWLKGGACGLPPCKMLLLSGVARYHRSRGAAAGTGRLEAVAREPLARQAIAQGALKVRAPDLEKDRPADRQCPQHQNAMILDLDPVQHADVSGGHVTDQAEIRHPVDDAQIGKVNDAQR